MAPWASLPPSLPPSLPWLTRWLSNPPGPEAKNRAFLLSYLWSQGIGLFMRVLCLKAFSYDFYSVPCPIKWNTSVL